MQRILPRPVPTWWNEVGCEQGGDGMDLVAGADKDEGGEENVHDRVVGDEDQHPVRVRAQPDVILNGEIFTVDSIIMQMFSNNDVWFIAQ